MGCGGRQEAPFPILSYVRSHQEEEKETCLINEQF